MISSNPQELRLSVERIGHVASIERPNFRFLIAGREIACAKFQAAFLSPRVLTLLHGDPTLDYFVLEHIREDCASAVGILRGLLEGGSAPLNPDSLPILKSLSEALGNDDIKRTILEFELNGESVCMSNVLFRVDRLSEAGLSTAAEVRFIASHFYEMDPTALSALPIDVLEAIISSEYLQVTSEDSLLDFICGLGSATADFCRYVECANLSSEGIDKFISAISHDNIDSVLWNSICSRLRCPIAQASQQSGRRYGENCKIFTDNEPFSGIISHLTADCGGNVHEHGVVSITASSTRRNLCHQVANHGWNDYWYSDNRLNSWIRFDFKDKRVQLTGYTVKSAGHGGHYLRQWAVEGSNDGSNWTALDARDTQELCHDYATKTFRCESQVEKSEWFQYVRLRQTGEDSTGFSHLFLCNLEFFGKLKLLTD
jgi:hypothetical protein